MDGLCDPFSLSIKANARYFFLYIFRHIIKDHVGILRWHRARAEDRKFWEKQINRRDFKVTASTVVCSNHFAAGYYNNDTCRIPTLYMKGYSNNVETTRKPPRLRETFTNPTAPKRSRNIIRSGEDSILPDIPIFTPPPNSDHNYDVNKNESCTRCSPQEFCLPCNNKTQKILSLEETVKKQQEEIELLRNERDQKKPFSVYDIKDNDKSMNFYTGLQSYEVFKWLYDRISHKVSGITYTNSKKESEGKKRGPKRLLSGEEEMFLTLVRIRLGLLEEDLAHRFKISQTSVSNITSTWCAFLAREWSIFIYWPTQEENRNYLPQCFSKWKNTIAILDCTEGGIEKPSLAKAQAQTYSTYKSKNTWKKLIAITPGGTVSFISKAYGGSASDRYIVEDSGILNNVKPGDAVMVDKGFNISDLLVGKESELVHPPFLKDKGKFSEKNVRLTSDVAKARIHVERAIARIKDFRIVQGNIPLSMKDQIDDIFIIIATINNIGPRLVPL